MQFMYLCEPTEKTPQRTLQQILLPHQPHLLGNLPNQSLCPERSSHQSLKMSSASSTNGCWKRSGRSSHATLQRRRNLMRRRPFSRSSSEQDPFRAYELISCRFGYLVSGVSPGMWLGLIGLCTSTVLYYLVSWCLNNLTSSSQKDVCMQTCIGCIENFCVETSAHLLFALLTNYVMWCSCDGCARRLPCNHIVETATGPQPYSGYS